MAGIAIKINETLAEQARTAALDGDRSLTGQIEHWARIGRAVEPLLPTTAVASLKKSGGDLSAVEDAQERARVLQILEHFRSLPRAELASQLGLDRKPRFEPDPSHPDAVIRILPDGSRQSGRMHGRTFTPDR